MRRAAGYFSAATRTPSQPGRRFDERAHTIDVQLVERLEPGCLAAGLRRKRAAATILVDQLDGGICFQDPRLEVSGWCWVRFAKMRSGDG
jgi:hypothetical protein